VSVLALALGAAVFANAQDGVFNVYGGVSTATAPSNGQQVDTFGTGVLYSTPKMTGLFPQIGGSYFFNNHWGAGADLSWRGAQGEYAGLLYRPMFYNFDAIYQVTRNKHIVPEFRAGLGGVHVGFYLNQQQCDAFVGCSTASQLVESSNHLQEHYSAAARMYLTKHVFVRPAFDLHHVENFNQFGRGWVPQYGVSLGFSMGSRE
jgi:hypothetical protein